MQHGEKETLKDRFYRKLTISEETREVKSGSPKKQKQNEAEKIVNKSEWQSTKRETNLDKHEHIKDMQYGENETLKISLNREPKLLKEDQNVESESPKQQRPNEQDRQRPIKLEPEESSQIKGKILDDASEVNMKLDH